MALRALIVSVALAAISGAWGCASGGVQRQDTATAGIEQLRSELEAGSEQVSAMSSAISALRLGEDLDSAYRSYTKELDRLEKQASRVRARRAAMQARLEDHISKWQEDMASVSNEGAQRATAARAASLKTSAERVKEALAGVKEAYDPYISNLLDIELILANDLSKRGVRALSQTFEETEGYARALRSAISDASVAAGNARGEFNR